MSLADWRALIEAFLDGRLSPEAFQRRFLEAWRAERDGGVRPRPAIENLFSTVEAFNPDPEREAAYDSEEQELRREARLALRGLREEEGVRPRFARTFDRARAREDIQRFNVHIGRMAGMGCLFALAWVAIIVLQINYASAQVQSVTGWDPWPSSFVGFFTAFVPVLGNVVAFFGAKDVGGWPWWIAAFVFLVLPAVGAFYGRWRWRGWSSRWRGQGGA